MALLTHCALFHVHVILMEIYMQINMKKKNEMVWISCFGAKSPLVSHKALVFVTQPIFAANYKDLWVYSSSTRDKRALIWLWLLLVPTDTSSQETPSTPKGTWSSSIPKSKGVYLTMKKDTGILTLPPIIIISIIPNMTYRQQEPFYYNDPQEK